MKRMTTGLSGVLAIDKPSGMTSHDVVDRVRRITGERRVGHAGTLDPAATGLMLVGVGVATRLCQYLTGHDKSYCARIVFGAATDTDDLEGRVVEYGSCGAAGTGLEKLAPVDAAETVASLVGTVDQLPPAYSAIKKNGVVAYKAAREGKELELEPRTVTIKSACLLGTGELDVDLTDGEKTAYHGKLPYWDIALEVSKGTYIRSIARDLGIRLGCGAYLGALRRTSVGNLRLSAACTLEQLAASVESGEGLPWCDPSVLLGYPVVSLDERQLADVSNGRQLSVSSDADLVSCVADGRLRAIYRGPSPLRPACVLPGGVAGVC